MYYLHRKFLESADMKKIKVIVFLIVCFFATIGVVLVFKSIDMHRQKACFRDVGLRLIGGGRGFFEHIDDESFITDNPQIVEEAMRDVLKEHPHFEPFLYGNSSLNLVDLLSDKCNVFQVGSYLYFPYDSSGKRIQWFTKGNHDHIILVDSKPLWNGNMLVGYAGNMSFEEVEPSVVLAFLDTYTCPSVFSPSQNEESNPQTDEN